MKIFTLYTFLFSLLISSCNNVSDNVSEKKITIKPSKEIVFDVGFPTMNRYSNIYYSLPDSTEYICFGDVNTNKKIVMFTLNGEKKYDIPLNYVINDGENIEDFSVISPDSILVLSQYTNKLYFLNQKGECWKKIYLDSIVKPANGDKFEYSSSMYQDFILNKNTLIFGCEWRSNKNDKEPKEQLEYSKYFYNNSFKASYFLKISNIFKDSIKYKFGLKNFHSKISNEPAVMVEGNSYYHYNNRLFCFSWYSDKIFEINPDLLTIKKEIQIKSKYTEIGCTPIPLNENTQNNLQDLINKNLQTQGLMNRFLYDNYRNLYYIIARHTASPNHIKDKKKADELASSLLIYDENFNKLKEILMPTESYLTSNILVYKEGILISNNLTSRKDYDRKKTRFMLFKVVEE